MERLMEGVREYRRMVEEESERYLAEEEAERLSDRSSEEREMSTTTEKSTPLVLPIKPLRGGNGMTDEQVERMLSLAGKYKDNPEYLEQMMEGVREYRQRIQEELERELAEAEEAERSK